MSDRPTPPAVPASHQATMTSLFMGIEVQDSLLVNLLLPHIDLAWGHGPGRVPVLCHAARHGALAVVNRVLSLGASPELSTARGETALWWAADRGHTAVVERLLGVVRPSLRDASGQAAFVRAVVGNHVDCARALATFSDLNQKSLNGNTPLMIAVNKGNEAMVTMLCEVGVIIDPPGVRNHLNQTALDLADKVPAIAATLRVAHERQVLRAAVNGVTNEAQDSLRTTPRARL